jgi:uncharacterized protein (DUF1501 family)
MSELVQHLLWRVGVGASADEFDVYARMGLDQANGSHGGADAHCETDFRSVYATIIDDWLGADSVSLPGGDFRRPGLDFV